MNGRADDDRPRRLADVGVSDARAASRFSAARIGRRRAGTGMPGFDQMLTAVADAWTNRREQVVAQADQLTDAACARSAQRRPARPATLDRSTCSREPRRSLERVFDHAHGGFGAAPKFPHPMDLRRAAAASGGANERRPALLDMVTHHARPDGGRRHLRSPRRRLPPLLGRRALAGAALREDALRQRAAGAGLPRGVPGHGRRRLCRAWPARRSTTCCAT